ncbi:uncharacterized protein TRIADDRAFT_20400 [Trichoplax adhaerens]|uniref:Ubiquitin-like domain-containing protein n=1 Tax=Trichoplax adhaerens TaxID=10228 RepID=B3RML5_TRIAD|nr:hypothetical protein TRIADDRAFT_20400 [Trichoplax adhaerens]EDV28383.1 hypothetical protein TRIADDRAFT_20400 [Trichoplax adhaerens]|eukprot:XP_002110217.1 hypothetical protein TRIADDRAFT_20400 [Trichoplax adhaerens]
MEESNGSGGGGSNCNEGACAAVDDAPTTLASIQELKDQATAGQEMISFRVVWKKKTFDVEFNLDQTIAQVKKHMEKLTEIPATMQKLMYKGLTQDSKTLRELKVARNSKMMLVGSTVNDIIDVVKPVVMTPKDLVSHTGPKREPLCKQKQHKKILDKGKPEGISPGDKRRRDPLPSTPISGMYNKHGSKVRLTFKLLINQLWIGTKEHTEKVPIASIRNVTSEPIEGDEDYHIMGLQLGPTELSIYWLYWMPAQYVEAIKDTILGKWQIDQL